MKEDIINYYNRIRIAYETVKPLSTQHTTIHLTKDKAWCQSFINFWKDVHGVDKQVLYNVKDLGDVVIIEQGKLSICFKLT